MNQKRWQDFYLFMYDAKSAAGIYFVAFVFFYLVFGVYDPARATTLDFWTSLQLFAACLLIGLGQSFLLSPDKVIPSRFAIWSAWSLIITVLFAEGFDWFHAYPDWYRFVFYGLIAVSFLLYWLALDWQLKRETKNLNHALHEYKQKNKATK